MAEQFDYDVAVIGAGAAGLMAAIFAASGGARVLVLESTSNGGRKILISGGGRCNVLPSRLTPTQYITSSSRHTLKKILLSWPLAEQRSYFEEELGIPLALEEESGKLFPATNRARDVRDALVKRAEREGAQVLYGSPMDRLDRGTGSGWTVGSGSAEFKVRAVIAASGGLSVPQTGSDGRGLRLLERLGHTVTPLYPALTPLTCDPPVHAELSGVSLHARLTAPPPGGPFQSEGGFLFTHKGYSGPAVLDISHLATQSATQQIYVSWAGRGEDQWAADLAAGGGKRVSTVLRQYLPERLAMRLLAEAEVEENRVLGQLRRDERKRLVEILSRYCLMRTGDEGYRKAEVTGGGIVLGEVEPTTLESRILPQLYLCGELLDAFGPIGGYNFAWAWATGRAAGRGAARSVVGGV